MKRRDLERHLTGHGARKVAEGGKHTKWRKQVSRRRLRRRSEKARRHEPAKPVSTTIEVVREATRVERLAYTRTQAAEALGVSRSTFDRRVLPLIETVEMPWGTKLIPVDELERLIAERRRPVQRPVQPAKRGRPQAISPDLSTTSEPSATLGGASARSQLTSTTG